MGRAILIILGVLAAGIMGFVTWMTVRQHVRNKHWEKYGKVRTYDGGEANITMK